jgi:hypothetical protein
MTGRSTERARHAPIGVFGLLTAGVTFGLRRLIGSTVGA